MALQLIDICSYLKQHLLPQNCLLCGDAATGLALCPGCHADLPWHTAHACPVCALPNPSGELCGACLKHPPAFDAALAVLDFHFPVNALLRRYKYSGFLAIAELLGILLAERVRQGSRPDLLIPMPLHPSRLKERGFNQAAEIARVVCAQSGLLLALQACSRTRPTPPQAGQPLQTRRKNLRGAFACQMDLSGQRIALLDDVMTTGASLDELARCVKAAGAAHVECWVVARTLKD